MLSEAPEKKNVGICKKHKWAQHSLIYLLFIFTPVNNTHTVVINYMLTLTRNTNLKSNNQVNKY